MAKSNNQKAKILYLERMLQETGEHKTLSMQDILAGLGEHGINAERKSIYDDVEVLRSIDPSEILQYRLSCHKHVRFLLVLCPQKLHHKGCC